MALAVQLSSNLSALFSLQELFSQSALVRQALLKATSTQNLFSESVTAGIKGRSFPFASVLSANTSLASSSRTVSQLQETSALFAQMTATLEDLRSLALHTGSVNAGVSNVEQDIQKIEKTVSDIQALLDLQKFGAKMIVDALSGKAGISDNLDITFIGAGRNTTTTQQLVKSNSGLTATFAVSVTQDFAHASLRAGQPFADGATVLAADEILNINDIDILLTEGMSIGNAIFSINQVRDQTGVSAYDYSSLSKHYLALNGIRAGSDFEIRVSTTVFNKVIETRLIQTVNTGLVAGVEEFLGNANGNNGATFTDYGALGSFTTLTDVVQVEVRYAGATVIYAATASGNANLTTLPREAEFRADSRVRFDLGNGGVYDDVPTLGGNGSIIVVYLTSFTNTTTDTVFFERFDEGNDSGLGENDVFTTGSDVQGVFRLVLSDKESGMNLASLPFSANGNGQILFVRQATGFLEGELGGLDLKKQAVTLEDFTAYVRTQDKPVARLETFDLPKGLQVRDAVADTLKEMVVTMRNFVVGLEKDINLIDIKETEKDNKALPLVEEALTKTTELKGALELIQEEFLNDANARVLIYKQNFESVLTAFQGTDFESKTVSFTRQKIIEDASSALKAHANLNPQLLLEFLD